MLTKNMDLPLLMMRLVLGAMFMYYGAPKFFAGPQQWSQLGQAVGNLHIRFGYTFWGFMASFSMFVGGLCLILGFLFRPFCFLLLMTMIVASVFHFSQKQGFAGAGHAIEDGVVFLGLMLIGPGRYSLDAWLASVLHHKHLNVL